MWTDFVIISYYSDISDMIRIILVFCIVYVIYQTSAKLYLALFVYSLSLVVKFKYHSITLRNRNLKLIQIAFIGVDLPHDSMNWHNYKLILLYLIIDHRTLLEYKWEWLNDSMNYYMYIPNVLTSVHY